MIFPCQNLQCHNSIAICYLTNLAYFYKAIPASWCWNLNLVFINIIISVPCSQWLLFLTRIHIKRRLPNEFIMVKSRPNSTDHRFFLKQINYILCKDLRTFHFRRMNSHHRVQFLWELLAQVALLRCIIAC